MLQSTEVAQLLLQAELEHLRTARDNQSASSSLDLETGEQQQQKQQDTSAASMQHQNDGCSSSSSNSSDGDGDINQLLQSTSRRKQQRRRTIASGSDDECPVSSHDDDDNASEGDEENGIMDQLTKLNSSSRRRRQHSSPLDSLTPPRTSSIAHHGTFEDSLTFQSSLDSIWTDDDHLERRSTTMSGDGDSDNVKSKAPPQRQSISPTSRRRSMKGDNDYAIANNRAPPRNSNVESRSRMPPGCMKGDNDSDNANSRAPPRNSSVGPHRGRMPCRGSMDSDDDPDNATSRAPPTSRSVSPFGDDLKMTASDDSGVLKNAAVTTLLQSSAKANDVLKVTAATELPPSPAAKGGDYAEDNDWTCDEDSEEEDDDKSKKKVGWGTIAASLMGVGAVGLMAVKAAIRDDTVDDDVGGANFHDAAGVDAGNVVTSTTDPCGAILMQDAGNAANALPPPPGTGGAAASGGAGPAPMTPSQSQTMNQMAQQAA